MDNIDQDEYLKELCRMIQESTNRFLEEKSDKVNPPAHYHAHGLEVVDVIKAFDLDFDLGTAIKYILRADKRGSRETDLEKAIWYLQHALRKD
jgi:Protein of unknwon function (DUF3310)